EDEGDVVFAAGVGEPVPAVHALAGDEEAVAEGGDGAEEGFGSGRQVAGEAHLAVGIEDDEEPGPGVPVDAGVESGVGGRLEGTHGEGLQEREARGGGWVPSPSLQMRAFMSIQSLHLTGAAHGSFGYNVPSAAPAGELGRSAKVPAGAA